MRLGTQNSDTTDRLVLVLMENSKKIEKRMKFHPGLELLHKRRS